MPEPPESMPYDEYVPLLDNVIDYSIKTVREDLSKGADPEAAFAALFHGLLRADEAKPGTDRMIGIATHAIMRLAQALETR